MYAPWIETPQGCLRADASVAPIRPYSPGYSRPAGTHSEPRPRSGAPSNLAIQAYAVGPP